MIVVERGLTGIVNDLRNTQVVPRETDHIHQIVEKIGEEETPVFLAVVWGQEN